MAADDYRVVMFKILSYLYGCLKEGVEPNASKAEEITGVNPVYWRAVVADMLDHGYVRADVKGLNGSYRGLSVTMEGVDLLETDPHMEQVKELLGRAFETFIQAAVKATVAL